MLGIIKATKILIFGVYTQFERSWSEVFREIGIQVGWLQYSCLSLPSMTVNEWKHVLASNLFRCSVPSRQPGSWPHWKCLGFMKTQLRSLKLKFPDLEGIRLQHLVQNSEQFGVESCASRRQTVLSSALGTQASLHNIYIIVICFSVINCIWVSSRWA